MKRICSLFLTLVLLLGLTACGQSNYLPDENGQLYLRYYAEYIWNADGSYGGYHFYDVAGEQDE